MPSGAVDDAPRAALEGVDLSFGLVGVLEAGLASGAFLEDGGAAFLKISDSFLS